MLKRRYEILGILSRFTDIMKANVNSVLEKAEDKNADKLLRKYIQDAKDDLADVYKRQEMWSSTTSTSLQNS